MYQRLHSKEYYLENDPELSNKQRQAQDVMAEFNKLLPSQLKEKEALMKKMFAKVGEGTFIEGAIYSNWGGRHVTLGQRVYINFNLTLVDDTHIEIGDYTMVGPNCTLATATHPLWGPARQKAYQKNLPIKIGKNCWLGAGVIVLPGVTIGDNTVIGAGSIVTKDLPANVVAVGNPCRVLREITETDREKIFTEMGL